MRLRKRDYLIADEIKEFLAAVKLSRNPQRDYCLALVIINHRLKVSEVISLRLRDIHLEGKKLYIAGLEGWHAFGDESAALKDCLGKRKEMNPPKSCDTIFISEQRRPMARNTVNLFVKSAADAAGLGHLSISPEVLRRIKMHQHTSHDH